MTKLILASASPRRKQLLEQIGVTDFEVRPAPSEIEADNLPPGEAVQVIALAKGQAIAKDAPPGTLILAADTEVYFNGALLGKPQDPADAERMLRLLSGATHRVYTGVALLKDDKTLVAVEATDVTFRHLTDLEIQVYVASGEPMDKAGAYGIQGKAAHFVRRIEGDVYNVIGLPLCLVTEMAREMGTEL